MPQKKIGLGYFALSKKAKRYVARVLASNRLSYGPFTEKYESLFARKHGARFAVVSNSGTVALQIALAALKETRRWKDGDEVLVPATTFIATPNVVLHNRLKPVFVEIDPLYYSMDPKKAERKITRRTRAMIPVHLFGQPADMGPLMKIARRHRLSVIEDSAETMLAKYRGRCVGTFGDISCFSTYMAHLLTTGVGGINLTDDPKLCVILRSLINHGRDSIYLNIDDDDKASRKKLRQIIQKRFSFIRLGHSARLTELESAIGLAALEDELKKSIAVRRKNAKLLTKLLKPVEDKIQLPAIRPGSDHSFMVYPVVLKRRKKHALVALLERNGIETRDLVPIINQPVYRKLYRFPRREYPVSQWLVDSGFYLGCHQGLGERELRRIASLIRHFLKS